MKAFSICKIFVLYFVILSSVLYNRVQAQNTAPNLLSSFEEVSARESRRQNLKWERINNRREITKVYSVQLADIALLKRTNQFMLNVPEGNFLIKVLRSKINSENEYFLYGESANKKVEEVLITVINNHLLATYRINGIPYSLEPLSENEHILYAIDPSKIPDEKEPTENIKEVLAKQNYAQNSLTPMSSTNLTKVRIGFVLVYNYDESYLLLYTQVAAVMWHLEVALLNSNISPNVLSFEYAGSVPYQIGFNTKNTTIGCFAAVSDGGQFSPPSTFCPHPIGTILEDTSVKSSLNAFQADIVVFNVSDGTLTWSGPPIVPYEYRGITVPSIYASAGRSSTATLSGYYTLTHEIGHLFLLLHERSDGEYNCYGQYSRPPNDVCETNYFAYKSQGYKDVMHNVYSESDPGLRTLIFSNPNVYYPGTSILAGALPYQNASYAMSDNTDIVADSWEIGRVRWSSNWVPPPSSIFFTPKANNIASFETLYTNKFKDLKIYPNPANPTSTLSFEIEESDAVKITLYDILGKQIQTITNGVLEKGTHQFTIDASGLATGLYLVDIQSSQFSIQKSIFVLK